MSTVVDVADAVVTALNAGSFSQPFTAERAYLPCYELDDIKQLRVTVVPKTVEMQASTRNSIPAGCRDRRGRPAETDCGRQC